MPCVKNWGSTTLEIRGEPIPIPQGAQGQLLGPLRAEWTWGFRRGPGLHPETGGHALSPQSGFPDRLRTALAPLFGTRAFDDKTCLE